MSKHDDIDLDSEELTEEQYELLMEELESFDLKFMEELSGSENFEIIPTSDEDGDTLDAKHYTLIKKECRKHGLEIIYSIDGPRQTVLFCPQTMKTAIINLNEEIH